MTVKDILNKLAVTSSFIVIPFVEADWTLLQYSSLPSNKVSFENKSMTIKVEKSASPIIYKLNMPISAKALMVKGEIIGKLNFDKKIQGEEKADDFAVRVGLVIEGDRRLNLFQKIAAPKWVKQLYGLSSDDTGIDKINFYNISQQSLNWSVREHPLSSLLHEDIVQSIKTGQFSFTRTLNKEERIIAIWLSSDGDDTGSSYSVRFDKIEFSD